MNIPERPRGCQDFRIAILCALRKEFDAVEAVLDKDWEEDGPVYPKAENDRNTYVLGLIKQHNVVLCLLPGMGKVQAATASANLLLSFQRLNLCFVVGICGGVPSATNRKDIFLGDVVISTGLIQYDFGSEYPHGFVIKSGPSDTLSAPDLETRGTLNSLQRRVGYDRLRNETWSHLISLVEQEGWESSRYPGQDQDRLFAPTYRHKHRDPSACDICAHCVHDQDPTCEIVWKKAECKEIGCSIEGLVENRSPPEDRAQLKPEIHFGLIASGDKVVKSALYRDGIAHKYDIVALEMEGVGVWENLSTVVIKGVCDYADSHKNKTWQDYASASAAACMKAFLGRQRPIVRDRLEISVITIPDLTTILL
ncbi:nucleoside phosphorylase domain-containing protein [Xylariales sp. PMI_506]|nr:nucleoside phosphorylase domain-containing protein [Xylariales sp. PMI_506]